MTDAGITRFFRRTLCPLFLLVCCPPVVILVWYTNVSLGGSLSALYHLISEVGLFSTIYSIWSPVFFGSVAAWKMLLIFGVTQLILMRFIPGKVFYGPVTPQGNVPVYKDNGITCFAITLAVFCLGGYVFHFFSPTIIYDHFGELLGALNISVCFFVCFYI